MLHINKHNITFLEDLFEDLQSSLVSYLGVSNGDLNLHTGFDADGGDLFDDLGWAVQIDQTLVDTHLITVPCFGPFTTGGLPGGNAEGLGGHAHRSLHLQLLVLGSLDQISAH